MITGEEVAEHIEMGGREAREKLAMKLPKFGAPKVTKPARRTDSLLSEVCTCTSKLTTTQAYCICFEDTCSMPDGCLLQFDPYYSKQHTHSCTFGVC